MKFISLRHKNRPIKTYRNYKMHNLESKIYQTETRDKPLRS